MLYLGSSISNEHNTMSTAANMTLSASWVERLRQIHNTLREVRYDLGRLLETAQCAEIPSLGELILSLEDLRHQAHKAAAPQEVKW